MMIILFIIKGATEYDMKIKHYDQNGNSKFAYLWYDFQSAEKL